MGTITIRFELTHQFLDRAGQRDGFILLAAFLVSFLFIRTSARLMRSPKVPWWPGSVTTGGGLHIHHLVWGIVLVLMSGFLRFSLDPKSPWGEILAAMFGIGMGFTLDEFALWVRLEDVYWSSEGRSSLDAVVVATVIGALVLLGIAPFDDSDASPGLSLLLVIGIDVLLCVIAILKGRWLLALLGLFLPTFSFFAAIRLAAPTSPWARRWYRPEGRKIQRSTERFAKARARHQRFLDVVGGRPSVADPAPAVESAAVAVDSAAVAVDSAAVAVDSAAVAVDSAPQVRPMPIDDRLDAVAPLGAGGPFP